MWTRCNPLGGGGGGAGASGSDGGDSYVMQKYLMNPHLISGVKYDLRLYVLMMGTESFPAFLSKEGLARFCTEPYAAPSATTLANVRAYLTNYALNKAGLYKLRIQLTHSLKTSGFSTLEPEM
jgi:hypothetical protein